MFFKKCVFCFGSSVSMSINYASLVELKYNRTSNDATAMSNWISSGFPFLIPKSTITLKRRKKNGCLLQKKCFSFRINSCYLFLDHIRPLECSHHCKLNVMNNWVFAKLNQMISCKWFIFLLRSFKAFNKRGRNVCLCAFFFSSSLYILKPKGFRINRKKIRVFSIDVVIIEESVLYTYFMWFSSHW